MTEDRDALVGHIAAILEEWDMKDAPDPFTGHAYEDIARDIITRASILPPTTSAGDGMPRKQLVSWMRERGLWQYELVLRGDGGFEETCRTKDGYGALGSAGDGELVERVADVDTVIAKLCDLHRRMMGAVTEQMPYPVSLELGKEDTWTVLQAVIELEIAKEERAHSALNPSPTEQEIPS